MSSESLKYTTGPQHTLSTLIIELCCYIQQYIQYNNSRHTVRLLLFHVLSELAYNVKTQNQSFTTWSSKRASLLQTHHAYVFCDVQTTQTLDGPASLVVSRRFELKRIRFAGFSRYELDSIWYTTKQQKSDLDQHVSRNFKSYGTATLSQDD